jgi:hypothetical protein
VNRRRAAEEAPFGLQDLAAYLYSTRSAPRARKSINSVHRVTIPSGIIEHRPRGLLIEFFRERATEAVA